VTLRVMKTNKNRIDPFGSSLATPLGFKTGQTPPVQILAATTRRPLNAIASYDQSAVFRLLITMPVRPDPENPYADNSANFTGTKKSVTATAPPRPPPAGSHSSGLSDSRSGGGSRGHDSRPGLA